MSSDALSLFTPSALQDLPIPTNPRLSPNAQQVVYQTAPLGRAGEHDKTTLWLAETSTEDSAVQLTSGLHHDRSPEWCPDAGRKLISFVSDRANNGKSNALYCLRVCGGEAYPVTDVKCEKTITSHAWSPSGSFVAYVSADEDGEDLKSRKEAKNDVKVYGERWEYARLRLLHTETKDVEVAFNKDEHVCYFAWSPDGKKLVFATTQTPEPNSLSSGENKFHVYDLAAKKVVQTVPWAGVLDGALVWAKTGIWFMAGVTPEKTNSSMAVYNLSLEESKCRRKAYGETSCVGGIRSYGDAVFIHELAGMTDNIILKGARFLQLDKEITSWDARHVNGDQPTVAFCASDVSTPMELYFHSGSGIKKLSSHAAKVANMKYAKMHDLKTKSFDGTTKLEGYYITPANHDVSKPLPTVVNIHGGPYYRRTQMFDPCGSRISPLLLASGKYGILVVNYRGGAGYGENFAAQARGAMGTVEYEDVIALVEEGIKRGFADKAKMIVSGWSQGGFLSYISAVRNAPGQAPRKIADWRFAGAICGAGVTDWDLMTIASVFPDFEGELAGGAPWLSEKTDVKCRLGSAIWELQKGAKNVPPLLLLHGEADETVPVTNAIAFHRGCMRHKIPCEMAIYPREPHGPEERSHQLDLATRFKRFVDLHIGC